MGGSNTSNYPFPLALRHSKGERSLRHGGSCFEGLSMREKGGGPQGGTGTARIPV